MDRDAFYTSPEWLALRRRVLDRDGNRCTVGRLLGGSCRGALHVHHVEPRSERPDLALDQDNCGTACACHHPAWESLRRTLVRRLRPIEPCRHRHPYREGRLACARRRARAAGLALDDRELALVA